MNWRAIGKLFGIDLDARKHEIDQAYDDHTAHVLNARAKVLLETIEKADSSHKANAKLSESIRSSKHSFNNFNGDRETIRNSIDTLLDRMKSGKTK